MTPAGSATGRLLGRGSIYTVATAAPVLSGLLVTPLLTRLLGPVGYGETATALVVMQFTVSLLAFGLPTIITRHVFTEGSGEAGARGIAVQGAGLAAAISAAAAGILLVVGIAARLDVWVFMLAALSGGLGAGIAMAQAIAVAREEAWHYVLLAFGMSLIAPAFGLAVVAWLNGGPAGYFEAVAVTYLVLEGIAYWRVITVGAIHRDLAEFRRSLKMAVPFVPHQLAVNSVAGALILVAGFTLGLASGGGVQVALYLGAVPVVIVSAISYAWTPILLSLADEDRDVHLTESAKAVTWLAALGGSAVAALAPWLILLLVPETFDVGGMARVTGVAGAAASFAAIYLAYVQVVIASGKTAMFAITSPAAVLGGAVIAWAAVTAAGIVGTGVGYVASYVLFAVLTGWVARRVSGLRLRLRQLVLPVAVGLIASFGSSLLGWATPVEIVTRVLLAALLVGAALAIFLKAVRGTKNAD